DVPSAAHQPTQQRDTVLVESELLERDRARAEPPDRDARAVDRERRDDGVETGAVGEPCVDHRRGAVEPQPERRDDATDETYDRRGVESQRDGLEPALPLDERATRAVEHDLGDRRVMEQGLERSQPRDLADAVVEQDVVVRGAQERWFVAEQVGDARAQVVRRVVERDARADEPIVHATLHGVRIDGRRDPGPRCRLQRGHAAAPRRPPVAPTARIASRAGRSTLSGARRAKTPASTRRAALDVHGTLATAGIASTSVTSRARSDDWFSPTTTAPAACATSGACTARRNPR